MGLYFFSPVVMVDCTSCSHGAVWQSFSHTPFMVPDVATYLTTWGFFSLLSTMRKTKFETRHPMLFICTFVCLFVAVKTLQVLSDRFLHAQNSYPFKSFWPFDYLYQCLLRVTYKSWQLEVSSFFKRVVEMECLSTSS